MSRNILPAMAAASVLALLATSAVEARARHGRHAVMRAEPAPVAAPAPAPPFMFYPQDIEGGVSGNLPFNNQIRKHTDPLNANGGR